MKLETIVVGLEFSPYSEIALVRAYQLANQHGAKVVVVHSLEDADFQPQKAWLYTGAKFTELLEEGKRETIKHLDQLAEKNKPPGVEVTTEVTDLEPDAAILDAAERHQADLIVTGTHGRTGFERLMLGKVAERVLRKSPVSVLVVRASETPLPSMSRILVPTDFSESAELALSTATELVADGGSIDLLHCWELAFVATGFHGMYEELVSYEPQIAEAVKKEGDELVAKYKSDRASLSFMDRKEAATRGIHHRLEEEAYDMVIMGSHGHRGVKRILLGSAAEATVRHANCSVLVVRQASE